jgi:hypothetical protein
MHITKIEAEPVNFETIYDFSQIFQDEYGLSQKVTRFPTTDIMSGTIEYENSEGDKKLLIFIVDDFTFPLKTIRNG